MIIETHQQISSNQDTAWSWPELSHDNISLLLIHVTML